MCTVQAPLAEVLTIVTEQSVAIFPDARARSVDNLHGIEVRWRTLVEPDGPAARETLQRSLLHASSAQPVREPGIVHHVSGADIDAVVQIATPPGDDVSAWRRLFLGE